jgi:hypothetical protein
LCYKHKNQSCKPLQGDNVHHSMDDIEFYNVSVDIVREKIDFNNYDYMDLSL